MEECYLACNFTKSNTHPYCTVQMVSITQNVTYIIYILMSFLFVVMSSHGYYVK